MADTTTTQIDPGVDAFFQRTLLIRAVPSFLHLRFAQVKDIPQGNSETVRFRRYTNLTAATTALTEGVTPTGSQLAKTDVTGTVAQYGDFVTLTDFLTMVTLESIGTETSELLGDQMGDSLDQICRNVIIAGTTVQYASTATTRATVASGMLLNADEVREAVRTLEGNNAKKIKRMVNPSQNFGTSPIRAAYIGIISHNTKFDIKDSADFVPVSEYSRMDDVMEDEIGTLDEVRFVMTTNAQVFSAAGSGSIDVHGTLILGRDYYGITRIAGRAVEMITKPLGSAGTNDPLNQRMTMGWKASFVAVRLNENFAVRIEHAVSS